MKNLIKKQNIWGQKISLLKKYPSNKKEPSFYCVAKEGFANDLDTSKLKLIMFDMIDTSKFNIVVSFYDETDKSSHVPIKLPEKVFLFEDESQPFLFPAGWWPCEFIYALAYEGFGLSSKPFHSDIEQSCKNIEIHEKKVGLITIQAQDYEIQRVETFASNCFVQDQYIIGFILDKTSGLQTVAFDYRERNLKDFIKKISFGPHKRTTIIKTSPKIVELIKTFNSDDLENGVNFGGNIMISPPVTKSTPKIDKGAAGPTVPEHPEAPFGKIIVGDSEKESIANILRIFLTSQKIQPVLPVDTSWLIVGHVDEFLSFVPYQTAEFKALYADPELMIFMLKETQKVSKDRCTNFFRGIYSYKDFCHETSLSDMLKTEAYNEELKTNILNPIKERLKQGLNMTGQHFISMPVIFEQLVKKTEAKTVNIVNLQYVNGHILLPRPFGPRLPLELAKQVVTNSLEKAGLKEVSIAEHPEKHGFWVWQESKTPILNIALYYLRISFKDKDAEERLISFLKGRTGKAISEKGLKEKGLEDILDKANLFADIIKSNTNNQGKIISNEYFEFVVKETCKIWIPEDTVDIIELYMYSVFKSINIPESNVHFIDDWVYHINSGEVHCGTVAERTLPDSFNVEVYKKSLETMREYSFAYDPKQ